MVSRPLEINCGLAKKYKWKHKKINRQYPLIRGGQEENTKGQFVEAVRLFIDGKNLNFVMLN